MNDKRRTGGNAVEQNSYRPATGGPSNSYKPSVAPRETGQANSGPSPADD